MKKLIMFGLVAIAACAVNAAAFSWSASSAANGVDGNGNVLTSTSDAATFVLCYLGNGAEASIDNAVVVQEGTWTIATNKKTGQTSAKVQGTYTGTGAEGFANGNVYQVLVQDSEGGLHTIAGVGTYTISGYSGDTWSGEQYTFASSNFVADKASYPASSTPADGPEPTSGLLLLVGAGLLGLRRKRA